MATDYHDVAPSVRRKLNVTWIDQQTEERLEDVVDTVAPALAPRCGLPADHAFRKCEPEWALFLNACLYEYSDALDDFWRNYAEEIGEAHLRNVAGSGPANA